MDEPARVTPADLVNAIICQKKLCTNCGDGGHDVTVCTAAQMSRAELMEKVAKAQNLGAFLGQTKKQKQLLEDAQVIAATRKVGEFMIPISPVTCFRCKDAGHMAFECPGQKCRHCGSRDHISYSCPTRDRYPFEMEYGEVGTKPKK